MNGMYESSFGADMYKSVLVLKSRNGIQVEGSKISYRNNSDLIFVSNKK